MIDIRETSQRCNTVQFVLGPKQKTDCVRFIFVKMIQGVFQNYTNVHKGFVVWPVGLGLPCWCLVCFHLWSLSTQKKYFQNGNTFWVDRNSRNGHYGPCPDNIIFEPDLFLNLFTLIRCTKSTDSVKTCLWMTKKFPKKIFHWQNFSVKKIFFGQKFFFDLNLWSLKVLYSIH